MGGVWGGWGWKQQEAQTESDENEKKQERVCAHRTAATFSH